MSLHNSLAVAATTDEDMVDILGSSLETLYDGEYTTIAHSSANEMFEYIAPNGSVLTLRTPDTAAANWALHASSVWVGAVFLADHLSWIGLDDHERPVRVLELGAGAGLPSLLCARMYDEIDVVVSDYPDELLIRTLKENVDKAGVSSNCRAVGYGWGTDPHELLRTTKDNEQDGFDVILAADTLWSSETHEILAESLKKTLRQTPQARIHLVAGLHTGRFALQKFMDLALRRGFTLKGINEHAANGQLRTRAWDPERVEDDNERRRWIVWISLAWSHV